MALGWTTHRAKRTYERLRLKLKRAAGQINSPARTMDETPPRNSLPHFLERLESGRRVWAMRPTSDMYLDMVINALPVGEQAYVDEGTHSLEITRRVVRRINAMEVVNVNLEKNLAEAKANLTRIRRDREDQQRNLSLIILTIAAAESDSRKEAENDILAGRDLAPSVQTRSSKLRTAARKSRNRLRFTPVRLTGPRNRSTLSPARSKSRNSKSTAPNSRPRQKSYLPSWTRRPKSRWASGRR